MAVVEVPVAGNGQGPLLFAAKAQRANPERVRATTNERFKVIIMFITRERFEAHCRNWNWGGKPFFTSAHK